MAIIGRGDIAKVINDRQGATFLLSGISNRAPLTLTEHLKEKEAIFKYQRNFIVYISSLSIYYSTNEYAIHKKLIEECIRQTCDQYCILRIGNITWGDNPNTIINFLTHKIKNNLPYEIRDEYRYLLDADELNHWIGLIPMQGKHEMNITGMRKKVEDIVYE